jgi:hypothetical protein
MTCTFAKVMLCKLLQVPCVLQAFYALLANLKPFYDINTRRYVLFCQKKFKLLFCFWSGFQVRRSLLVRNKHINSQILSFIPFFKSFNPSLKTFLNSFLSCKLLFLDNLVGKLNQSWKHFVRTRLTCPNIYMPCDNFLRI